MSNHFNVLLNVLILSLNRGKVQVAVKNGEMPSRLLCTEDTDLQDIANNIFIGATGLNPKWVGLQLSDTKMARGEIHIYFKAVISSNDVLKDGYSWTHDYPSNVDRSLLHV